MKVSIPTNKLNKKVASWTSTKKGEKTIDATIAEGSASGIIERITEMMTQVANMFIQVLKDTASRRIEYTTDNQSVQRHFDSLKASNPSWTMRDGKIYGVVYVYFSDEDLGRDSLLLPNGDRTGDGISNIIALFNNGYELKSKTTPRGVWEGHNENKPVRAKRKREELGFMQAAASIIKRTYKDVDAIILSDEYND